MQCRIADLRSKEVVNIADGMRLGNVEDVLVDTISGRVLALEIMVPNAAIRNLIREDKVHQIYSQMQIGQQKHNMQTFNQSLCSLVQKRLISMEDAFAKTSEPDELRNILSAAGLLQMRPQAGARPIPQR